MSHLALRRVTIRLLHDPAFAARVAAEPDAALAGIDLTADERGWLAAAPAAAWRTDPARPRRVLAALAEEFPATLALAAARAEGFFAAPEFHDAIQTRGSLAAAFGTYMTGAADARARAMARLERAIAAVRRAPPAHAARPARERNDRLALTARAFVLRVPTGALALLADLRAGRPGGTLGSDQEPVLVAAPPTGDDVTLEPLAAELAALLVHAGAGCTRAELVAEARRLGAETGEDEDIIARLEHDGLLVGAASSPV